LIIKLIRQNFAICPNRVDILAIWWSWGWKRVYSSLKIKYPYGRWLKVRQELWH
jgi:hypothetical protein